VTGPQPDDLAALRAAFPGWEFEAHWQAAVSGPDRRHLMAHHDGLEVTISAWSADDLAAQVTAAILAAGAPGGDGEGQR
jgi:hypothetical protein